MSSDIHIFFIYLSLLLFFVHWSSSLHLIWRYKINKNMKNKNKRADNIIFKKLNDHSKGCRDYVVVAPQSFQFLTLEALLLLGSDLIHRITIQIWIAFFLGHDQSTTWKVKGLITERLLPGTTQRALKMEDGLTLPVHHRDILNE